jgi:hypothetical protein
MVLAYLLEAADDLGVVALLFKGNIYRPCCCNIWACKILGGKSWQEMHHGRCITSNHVRHYRLLQI